MGTESKEARMPKFTKQKLKEIRGDLDDLLDAIREMHGIDIKLGTISFNDVEFTAQLKAQFSDLSIEDTPKGRDWTLFSFRHGLPVELLGQEIVIRGRKMKIMGYNRDCPKNDIALLEVATGKNLKGPAALVKEALA